jgi:hypothetical protein
MAAVARFCSVAQSRRSCLTGALCLASCMAIAQEPRYAERCPDTAARVYLDPAGFITVNGHTVLPEDLSHTVASLKPREVCFAPVDPNIKPRPEIRVVFKTVTELKLPVYLYTDSTFHTRIHSAVLPSNNRWRGP